MGSQDTAATQVLAYQDTLDIQVPESVGTPDTVVCPATLDILAGRATLDTVVLV